MTGRGARSIWPGLALCLAALAYWKLRIVDSAELLSSRGRTVDLFTEHMPMVQYGFERLRAGELPLWNPWQLAGLPFLAVPHTGLLYPGNFPYWVLSPALATEASLVLHLAWAGLGASWLVRSFGMSGAAALAAGLTFMLSGWLTTSVHQSALVSTMSWLPVTLLAVERCARGGRLAPLGLAAAVACQILAGATEYALYNAYVAMAFVAFRWTAWSRERPAAVAARVALAAVAGVALAAPQLLPSLDLVLDSVRAPGSLDPSDIEAGRVGPVPFAFQWLIAAGKVSVGVLPVLGLAFGPRDWRRPGLWGFAAAVSLASAALVFGGAVYELYRATPLGGLFRFPHKWLHVFAFGQCLLAALAVERLIAWRDAGRPRARMLRDPRLLAGACLLVAGGAWAAVLGLTPAAPWLGLGALAAFAGIASPRARTAAFACLIALHAALLFTRMEERYRRPWQVPHAFESHALLLDGLGEKAGAQRVYLSPRLRLRPSLTTKQGMLRRFRVVADYETLSPARYAAFFARAAGAGARLEKRFVGPMAEDESFVAGIYALDAGSDFALMDLASTRVYALLRDGPADRAVAGRAGFQRVLETARLRVYERAAARPRAYWVGRARAVSSEGAALDALQSPDFDSAHEVVLEIPGQGELPPAPDHAAIAGEGATARVVILEDASERVEIEVEAPAPGYLVLTDAFDSGWRASAGGEPLAIVRANHLFRAVAVGAGRSQVRFEYRPPAWRRGLALASLGLALAIAAGRIRA